MTRPILENFKTESEAFEEVKDRDEQAFPAYKSGINHQVYVETVQAWLQATPGQLDVPLTYLIREKKDPGTPPPLGVDKCFSDKYKSLVDELIAYMPLSNTACRKDDKFFAGKIKLATINSLHYATLKPYFKEDEGREAYFKWTTLLTSKAEWAQTIETAKAFLRKAWNFEQKGGFKTFLSKFTTAVSTIAQAAEAGHPCTALSQTEIVNAFISCLTLDQRGRPEQLSALNTALSVVRQNANGEMHSFDLASKTLTDNMPVEKKRARNDDSLTATISNVSGSAKRRKRGKPGKKGGDAHTGGNLKNTTGKTGVDLRTHHTQDEIKQMSAEQKAEYFEWRYKRTNKDRLTERSTYSKKLKTSKAKISALKRKYGESGSDDEEASEGGAHGLTNEQFSALVAALKSTKKAKVSPKSKTRGTVSATVAAPEEESCEDSLSEDDPEESASTSDSPEEEEDDMSDSWSDGYSSCDEEQVSYQISDEDYDSDEDQASISD
jgi:hypothetical protein